MVQFILDPKWVGALVPGAMIASYAASKSSSKMIKLCTTGVIVGTMVPIPFKMVCNFNHFLKKVFNTHNANTTAIAQW